MSRFFDNFTVISLYPAGPRRPRSHLLGQPALSLEKAAPAYFFGVARTFTKPQLFNERTGVCDAVLRSKALGTLPPRVTGLLVHQSLKARQPSRRGNTCATEKHHSAFFVRLQEKIGISGPLARNCMIGLDYSDLVGCKPKILQFWLTLLCLRAPYPVSPSSSTPSNPPGKTGVHLSLQATSPLLLRDWRHAEPEQGQYEFAADDIRI
jgi:hypothetical protein